MTDGTPKDAHGQESESGPADDGSRATPDAARTAAPIALGIASGSGPLAPAEPVIGVRLQLQPEPVAVRSGRRSS